MQAINISGTMLGGSTVYRDIAIDICDGCILTTFMLTIAGVLMQTTRKVKDDVRQHTQRAHDVLLTQGISAVIAGNVTLAIVFMLGTLKWKTA